MAARGGKRRDPSKVKFQMEIEASHKLLTEDEDEDDHHW